MDEFPFWMHHSDWSEVLKWIEADTEEAVTVAYI